MAFSVRVMVCVALRTRTPPEGILNAVQCGALAVVVGVGRAQSCLGCRVASAIASMATGHRGRKDHNMKGI